MAVAWHLARAFHLAGFHYTDSLGQLAFLEARGYTAELFSGDRLRSVDAAVPHQLFATSGFVSALLRGLVGFDANGTAAGDALTLRPTLPVSATGAALRPALQPGSDAQTVALRIDDGAGEWGEARLTAEMR